jgi:putative membrane protein
METMAHNLFYAIVYSAVGLALFGAGFYTFDRLTPYRLWDELIKEKNVALAIVVGAASIGISLIISAAVH